MRIPSVAALLLVAGAAYAAPTLTLSLGATTVRGAFDIAAANRVIKASETKLLACYQAAVARDPLLAGTAIIAVVLGDDGAVRSVAVSGLGADDRGAIRTCIAGVINKLRFARPAAGQPVELGFRLSFASATPRAGLAHPAPTPRIDQQVRDAGKLVIRDEPDGAGFAGGGTGTGPPPAGLRTFGARKARHVALGEGSATGAAEPAIRRILTRNLGAIDACYERELASDPKLAGTLRAKFSINPAGKVSRATATGLSATLETCVASALTAIRFLDGRGDVDVTYLLVFRLEPAAPTPSPAAN